MEKIAVIPKHDLSVAEELHRVQDALKPMLEREKELKEALLLNLKSQGVKSVKLDNGTIYVRALRVALKVKKGDEDAAWAWAEKNNSLKIDTGTAKKILMRKLEKLPKFFVRSETEYLSIKGGDEDDE